MSGCFLIALYAADLFSLKKRLESELEELRAALAESEGGGGRGRSRRASDGVLSVRTGVRSISRHDASEEEEEEEEDKYLYSPSGSSEGEEEEEEARTPPPARNSKKGKQLEVSLELV